MNWRRDHPDEVVPGEDPVLVGRATTDDHKLPAILISANAGDPARAEPALPTGPTGGGLVLHVVAHQESGGRFDLHALLHGLHGLSLEGLPDHRGSDLRGHYQGEAVGL